MVNHNVPILAYHKVKDGFDCGVNKVSVHAFQKQMQYLSENHYYTITFEDLVNQNFEKTEKRRPVIISFDDADESVLKNAYPILNRFKFCATVFVISNFVGRSNSWDYGLFNRSLHLSWDEINQLSEARWEIASHTETHPNLKALSEKELFDELSGSKKLISQKIDGNVHFISYPFNKFNRRIADVAQQLGYLGGCGLYIRKNVMNGLKNYAIPRLGVYAIDSIFNFKNKLNYSWFEIAKQRVISFFSNGTLLYKQLKL